MPNIIFNGACNRSCPYCFADGENRKDKQLTLDNLTVICDFLQRSGRLKINVLGGEPSLHPKFVLFLEYLISRNFSVHVFTNGMIPPTQLKGLIELIAKKGLSSRRLKFVININEQKYRSPIENKMQKQTFSALHDLSTLSFNIYQAQCQLDFLGQTIQDYQLIKEIRLGLAAPVLEADNYYLSPAEYPKIAKKIVSFSDHCQSIGIDLVLDCGFTLCMFSDEELGKLYKHKTQLKFVCRPIPDIDPELNVFHCYPLARYFPGKLTEFKNLAAIYRYFTSLLERENGKGGVYKDCVQCRYRERGMCAGGCLGHYINKDITSRQSTITDKTTYMESTIKP